MKKVINTIILGFLIVIFVGYIYGCFGTVHKNKDLINMLLKYYPEHTVEIIESDPNEVMILIKKGE